MASTSARAHLSRTTRAKFNAILARADLPHSGSPASDRAAELLRDLSAALDAFGTRSVDIANAARRAGE